MPNAKNKNNDYALSIPGGTSLIFKHDAKAKLDQFPNAHPPVAPLFWAFDRALTRVPLIPLLLSGFIMSMGFCGLAYSIYPFVVMDSITIWQAAAAPASLKFILVGVAITVPMIGAYTIFAYPIFGGKATSLRTYNHRHSGERRNGES